MVPMTSYVSRFDLPRSVLVCIRKPALLFGGFGTRLQCYSLTSWSCEMHTSRMNDLDAFCSLYGDLFFDFCTLVPSTGCYLIYFFPALKKFPWLTDVSPANVFHFFYLSGLYEFLTFCVLFCPPIIERKFNSYKKHFSQHTLLEITYHKQQCVNFFACVLQKFI